MSECSDSDGVNYSSRGNVSLKVNGAVQTVEYDSCTGNSVVEMVCNSDGTASKLDQVCDNGCSEGKCTASTSSSSGGGSSGSSSSGSSGSGVGYSAGSSRSPSTTTTTTTSSSPVVNAPTAPATTTSNQNTESNNEAQTDVECRENSECASNLCLNGACVGTSQNNVTVQSRRSFIEMICNVANPFDERGYKSCLRFFGKGKAKN